MFTPTQKQNLGWQVVIIAMWYVQSQNQIKLTWFQVLFQTQNRPYSSESLYRFMNLLSDPKQMKGFTPQSCRMSFWLKASGIWEFCFESPGLFKLRVQSQTWAGAGGNLHEQMLKKVFTRIPEKWNFQVLYKSAAACTKVELAPLQAFSSKSME